MSRSLVVSRPSRTHSGADPSVAVDCERLDVYKVAVEFQLLVSSICTARGLGSLRNQLERASVSVVLNIAEGAGRFAPAEKASFYSIAHGSAMESIAALSLLSARTLIQPAAYRNARALVTRVIAMLERLVRSFRRS